MYNLVKKYIEDNGMIEEGEVVLAGVSGGGDSMAMLHMLRHFQKEKKFHLCAVHVHHGIRREEADRDEAFVEQMCEEWGILCKSYRYPVPELAEKWKTGIEETGRMVRREAFQRAREEIGLTGKAYRIALAHNRNDLGETMLHHLARGTGLGGLSTMKAVNEHVIRPILCLEKEQILKYLEREQVKSILDSSNLCDDYTRNRIRHHILPLLEQEVNARCVRHMADTACFLGEADDYFRKQAAKLCDRCVEGERLLFGGFLEQEASIIKKYVVMEGFERLAGHRRDFSSVHVKMVLELFAMDTGSRVSLPYGLMALRSYEGIYLQKEPYRETVCEEACPLEIPGVTDCSGGRFLTKIFLYEKQKIEEKKYTKWLDYDKIANKLYVRTRRPGDYLVINREGNCKKLNRVMIDDKIPGEDRDIIPLVAAENEILWIAGGRINEKYKITSATRRVLELKYQGGKGNE